MLVQQPAARMTNLPSPRLAKAINWNKMLERWRCINPARGIVTVATRHTQATDPWISACATTAWTAGRDPTASARWKWATASRRIFPAISGAAL
eukprot:10017356-Heterocapsa_arctica.AAC.1